MMPPFTVRLSERPGEYPHFVMTMWFDHCGYPCRLDAHFGHKPTDDEIVENFRHMVGEVSHLEEDAARLDKTLKEE